MGIAEDFSGLKPIWTELSWPSKIGFSFSLILSFLSIGSLADSVYKFKGFIFEAIAFWHVLGELIIAEVSAFGISVEQWHLDYWTIVNLSFIPVILTYLPTRHIKSKKLYAFVALTAYLVLIFRPIKFGYIDSVTLCGFLYLGVIFIMVLGPGRITVLEKRVLFRMLFPVFFLCVIAAIIEGGSRVL